MNFIRSVCFLLLGLGLGLVAAGARAESHAYMSITGAVHGPVPGNVTAPGREGMIAVAGVSQDDVSPTDAGSGLPVGTVQHKPMTVRKDLDKSSPLLHGMLLNHELLTSVVVQFWRVVPGPAGTSADQHYYTIKLKNARIVSIREKSEDQPAPPPLPVGVPALTPAQTKMVGDEEVTFMYEGISWTWVDGNITYEDNGRPY